MDLKQAMVVRTDIPLSKGKVVIAAVRASIAAAEKAKLLKRSKFMEWLNSGQKKVVLKTSNRDELDELARACGVKKVTTVSFTLEDLGFANGKETIILGIGPDREKTINSLTGHLKLL
ncbi:MAG: peptidyl-tRNA hydrolase [Candidatus Hodarchaeales archaeon]